MRADIRWTVLLGPLLAGMVSAISHSAFLLTERQDSKTVIEVLVLDSDGKPCRGANVFAVECNPPPRGKPELARTMENYYKKATSNESGIARFEDAERLFPNAPFAKYVVRFAIPPMHTTEAGIKASPLESQRIELRKPPTGKVRFLLDRPIDGKVLLRAKLEPGAPTFWKHDHPCYAIVSDRVALFEEVGLGCELEYELRYDDERAPTQGVLFGPREVGEVVTERVTTPNPAEFPSFTGRILDENLRPIASAEIRWSVHLKDSHGKPLRGGFGRFQTGTQGEFEVKVNSLTPPGGTRRLSLGQNLSNIPTDRLHRFVDISEEYGPGVHDLGDVALLSPTAITYVSKLSDGELIAFYRSPTETGGNRVRQVEAALLEMAERREEFVEFLKDEFDSSGSLSRLIALRRAQGKPDPVRLEVLEDSKLVSVFPETPLLRCRLVNVDVDGASVTVTDADAYEYLNGWLPRCRLDASMDGEALRCLPPAGMHRRVEVTQRTLAPAEILDFELKVDQYLDPPKPGEVRARVLYHGDERIADVQTVEGYAVVRSEEVRFQFKPCVVHSTREKQRKIKEWIAGLEIEERRILLVREPWRPGMEFVGEPETNRDLLFRTGWEAAPALIESLKKDVKPRVKANRLALLWNILGYLDPDDRRELVVGSHEWAHKWPTAKDQGPSPSGVAELVIRLDIDPEGLQRVVDEWLEVAAAGEWLRLEVED